MDLPAERNRAFRDVVMQEPETASGANLEQVPLAPRDQVVDRDHLRALPEQPFTKMRSDESRAAQDDDAPSLVATHAGEAAQRVPGEEARRCTYAETRRLHPGACAAPS